MSPFFRLSASCAPDNMAPPKLNNAPTIRSGTDEVLSAAHPPADSKNAVVLLIFPAFTSCVNCMYCPSFGSERSVAPLEAWFEFTISTARGKGLLLLTLPRCSASAVRFGIASAGGF